MVLGDALVLGGGGVTGVAWETGVLAGLSDAGLDLALLTGPHVLGRERRQRPRGAAPHVDRHLLERNSHDDSLVWRPSGRT